MVSSRRTSGRGKLEAVVVQTKARKRSVTPDSPNKRRRKNDEGNDEENDERAFNSESDNLVLSSRTRSGRDSIPKNTPKKTKTQYINGNTPTKTVSNGRSMRSREKSPSLPSETSSDPLTTLQNIPDTPIKTPTKIKNGIKVKSAKKDSPQKDIAKKESAKTVSAKKDSAVFDDPTPKSTPAKAFQKRLQAVKHKRTPSADTEPESIAIDEAPEPVKSKSNQPTHSQLEAIKAHVLGKLCGRIPIPLIGDTVKTAEYPHS
jgi:hypothetical protein